jgi:S-formylglutathione hydrolase FrmB
MLRLIKTAAVGAVFALLPATGLAVVDSGTAHAETTLTMVHSDAMNRNIPVMVLRAPGNGPAPTLYLLDGLRAPDDNNGWLINTDVVRFFADKHVNVAIPFGGGGTFYSDWEHDDPKLGHVRWETFLTKELPPVMAAKFDSDGVNNAVAGLSMSGTSALNLAEHHPDFYKAVASFSGYPTASGPLFAQGIQVAVEQMGGDPDNMWGPWPSPDWGRNDPLLGAAALRGKHVYISSGSGIPGTHDATVNPASAEFSPITFVQLVPLETGAGLSNRLFLTAVRAEGIDPVTDVTGKGIHWWTYWQQRLHEAWFKTFAPAFGE